MVSRPGKWRVYEVKVPGRILFLVTGYSLLVAVEGSENLKEGIRKSAAYIAKNRDSQITDQKNDSERSGEVQLTDQNSDSKNDQNQYQAGKIERKEVTRGGKAARGYRRSGAGNKKYIEDISSHHISDRQLAVPLAGCRNGSNELWNRGSKGYQGGGDDAVWYV